jgi:hypothetical protein
MAGLITIIQDAVNPHVRFVISSPDEQEITAGQIRHRLKRAGVVSWGWQVADERIVFRVYKPYRYTAKGVLEEAGVEFD